MDVPRAPIEINFSPGTLTYAEKLLLKKHRRSNVQTLSSGHHIEPNSFETEVTKLKGICLVAHDYVE